MIYLVFNVIFASAFMLSIKWVQIRKKEDVITVGALNYIFALLILTPEFSQLSSENVTSGALWTGGIMGACYFTCYFFVIYAIKYIGASSSTVVAVLSIVLPITCGVFIWGEQPNTYQVIGIVLALASLMLIGGNSNTKRANSEQAHSEQAHSEQLLPSNSEDACADADEAKSSSGASDNKWVMPVVLIVFFLLAGFARLAQEAFKHVSVPESRPTFLISAFTIAAIPSVILLIVRRKRIRLAEFGFGALMGVANALQTHFILKSLNAFEGFVVFPVTSAGGLILTTIIATRLMAEKLNFRTYIGITIACVALVLLHWLPGSE